MEKLIVFALVFLLPTQLAYHFWTQSSYIHGLRVDYLSPAVYLTDILIVLLLPYIKKRLSLFIPIILFALINTIFAQLPLTALLKWLVIFKLIILGMYFYSCDLHKLKKTISTALSLSLIMIFLIGLLQFLLQRTVGGPLYYLGERSFTSATPGISLMNFFGESMMRAYSTFSHPNSFAGFVVVSYLILMSFKKPFPLFGVVLLSLFLTFSLNAMAVSCLALILFFAVKFSPKVIKKIKILMPATLIGLSFLFGIMSPVLLKDISLGKNYEAPRSYDRDIFSLLLRRERNPSEAENSSHSSPIKSGFFAKGDKERVIFAGHAIETFSKRPILGVGLNNFFFAAKSVQPPHNIYLIVLSETGIIGILVLYFLLSKLLRKKLNNYLFLAVFFVLVTGLFDHYWFTLQQNQLLLSFLLGLSIRKVYH